ncbi:MAG: DUF1858 domain-containing protein [Dehalococcoidia bacterium]|nr:DUF1858 domain-containing protein [Dehalococcoidia bacterium]
MLAITKDTLIGDIIKTYPWAEPVIRKHFGQGCFTCPGMNMESISFGAMMHRKDPDLIVQELLEEASRSGVSDP